MAKQLVLILNPSAGLKQGKRYLADIISIFEAHDYVCLTLVTRQRGDAPRLAAQYAPTADLVVAIGGDGTFNEVISGLIASGATCPVGYIPAGSTNDLGASLGLSRNLLQCAQEIMEGAPSGLDVGSFSGRSFTYVASFGAFTRASYAAQQNVKNLLGHLAYVLEGAKDLWSLHPEHVRFETDAGDFEDDYIFGAISNSTSVGGVLTLDQSRVSLNDGKFELLLIRMPKNLIELNQIISAITTQNYDNEMLSFRSIHSARILGRADMPWTLDGEYQAGAKEFLVENLHQRIQMLLPKADAAVALPGPTE